MQYFPLFVDTQGLRVLLVGAGEVATRKLDLLSRTDAIIHVVAPEVAKDIEMYHQQGRIRLSRRVVTQDDIANIDIVYLATANEQLNMDFADLANERGIWVNVVDNPSYCRFITPSIVDRGRLVVAISTAGAAPVFARTIRSRLETMLPATLAPLFDFVASKREEVQQTLADGKDRRLFWERFFNSNQDKFDNLTEQRYIDAFQDMTRHGEILLLTEHTPACLLPIAAMPLLQKLDVIYSDEPVDDDTNELLRRDANRTSMPKLSEISQQYELGERMLIVANSEKIAQLIAHFPIAKHLRPGAL
ncbi:bifunctional precorrin-2 dehydrogenase/sirohydrochlorin ferrochelatase [Shewanella inventionis]|uniref:precorrin-2 dehydrogenase n=1 Tax=Shewanella inventionis TaxID=1738770 RepID=A0ABQ1INI7_9GAMM|nr:bifunctional precorrin-2 dehydrogenase/sirohydrochlorin ferrochelatase [Shewanella inventionis]MCL1159031.1 bifunctional precorrin-2 dehydrogenase/sirohydrochlorin ferrochelatase [Shewanella inventionis]UAL42466.1 bifunctional precorrin-2 dehydrogenase/sirohydrochlorin ferrochelatase [Shewanella inventionis]GGB47588.1 siroheme synthase [Shewanella inventionis]